MKWHEMVEYLNTNDFEEFFEEAVRVGPELTLDERKEVLLWVIDYYDHSYFESFKKAFDAIIGDLNLNFQVYDEMAPHFLGEVLYQCPMPELLDYFISKGADINYFADLLAVEGEPFDDHDGMEDNWRYQTTLDSIEFEMQERLRSWYEYTVPEQRFPGRFLAGFSQADDDVRVFIPKGEYLSLLSQAEYLKRLVDLQTLKDYVIALGGKRYLELEPPE
jgi:hypothetical protein